MDAPPLGFRWLENENSYACMCGRRTGPYPEECQFHISEELDGGYCENGFRCLSDTHYECVCGEKFETHTLAWSHRVDIYDKCLNIALFKARSYCQKCDIRFKTPYALKAHLKTARHLENEGPILKETYCKVCDIQCQGPFGMKNHLNTKKHAQRVEYGKIDLECKPCGITCLCPKQMIAHLNTKKHKKNV